MSAASSIGGRAMKFPFQAKLARCERYSFARWTYVLPSRRFTDCVIEIEFPQDRFEIVNVDLRRETLAAPDAADARIGSAFRLIQLHAELCGSLKNVEELSER